MDARLTPLDPRSTPLTPAGGGTARSDDERLALRMPPGALSRAVDIRLTELSAQGLPALLPLGYSPLGSVDIEPDGERLAQLASLEIPVDAGLVPGAQLQAARYDRAAGHWIALAPAAVDASGRQVRLDLDVLGPVAFLVADPAPAAPPAAVVGQELVGLDPATPRGLGLLEGSVDPAVAAADPDARALGRLYGDAAAPALPVSGTAVTAFVSERFDLSTGSVVVPRPFEEDFVLYRDSAEGRPPVGELAAHFPITPSQAFDILELAAGRVTLDVRPRQAQPAGLRLGPAGGQVSDSEGKRLELPTGALARDVAVEVVSVAAPGLPLPSGFATLGAVDVDLAGEVLGADAILAMPRPPDLVDAAPLLVVQSFVDAAGIPRVRIVARGRIDATRLVSDASEPGLPGIRGGGRYAFVRTPGLLGLVSGIVRAVGSSGPQSGALVTSSSAPFVDETAADGAYLVAAASSATSTIDAREPVRDDSGRSTADLGPGDTALSGLDVLLLRQRPTVVATTPAVGERDVSRSTPLSATFSEPLEASSVDTVAVQLFRAGAPVEGRVALSASGRVVRFLPDAELESATDYELRLGRELLDLAGNALDAALVVPFRTADTSKPPAPEAGRITAELPDDDGQVLVVGTQGSAEPGSGVTLGNLRTRETLSVLALDDGSFRLRIPAQLGDELALTLRDSSGRRLSLDITRFVSPDGTTALGAAGGSIDGSGDRRGAVLPRALSAAGLFRILDGGSAPLPTLGSDLTLVDRFAIEIEGARFRRIERLELSEDQGRLGPLAVAQSPFARQSSLVVPSSFLTGGELRFDAEVRDEDGLGQQVTGATLVVASSPDTTPRTVRGEPRFPTLRITTPEQAQPGQQLQVRAVAPQSRIDFDLPLADPSLAASDFLLARLDAIAGDPVLVVVDALDRVDGPSGVRLQTRGDALPGVRESGEYVVLASSTPLSEVEGRVTGPPAAVRLQGTPLVAIGTAPNQGFVLPVSAGSGFSLAFVDPADGSLRGTASDTAPPTGATLDLGEPLGSAGGNLVLLSARPGPEDLAEIGATIELEFDQAIDAATAGSNTLVVTDENGASVTGRIELSSAGRVVRFTPLRRFAFGSRYRYGVSRELRGESGARLAAPFDSGFTTFAPSLRASVPLSRLDGSRADAVDVAAADGVVVLASENGVSAFDIGDPGAPRSVASWDVAGGSTGVALLPFGPAPLVDRAGNPIARPLVAALSGGPADPLRAELLDLLGGSAPTLLGSVELGPASAATVRRLSFADDGRAVAAIDGRGLVSLDASLAIPVDPTDPGGAVLGREPADSSGSARAVARISRVAAPDLLLAASRDGLELLDGASLAPLGFVSTQGQPAGVDGLSFFGIDLDLDGAIDPDRETGDLAVVANGPDGLLQLFDVTDPTQPRRTGLVRLPHPALDVAVDRDERIAYVAGAEAGVSLVDLDGPRSLQPIDLDRDGFDDRILGRVATAGAARRVVLALDRGVGFVADGPEGLGVVELLPPRTRFAGLVRDPVVALDGDEESILASPVALLSDDRLELTVEATVPAQELLTLTLSGPGASDLRLPGGLPAVSLLAGRSELVVEVVGPDTGGDRRATFEIRNLAGGVVGSLDLDLRETRFDPATIESLAVGPDPLLLGEGADTASVSVAATFSDGSVRNVTDPALGTRYELDLPSVASVDAQGLVTGRAAGTAILTATNAAATALGVIEVSLPGAVVGLEVSPDEVTLASPGAAVPLSVVGVLSNQATVDLASDPATTYQSASPGVVGVDSTGNLTPVANGFGRVTVTNGGFSADVDVYVDLRTPARADAIALAPLPTGLDASQAFGIEGRITGGGSLGGLDVQITVRGPENRDLSTTSRTGGTVFAALEPLPPGAFDVRLSVGDPSSGATRSDQRTLVVMAAPGDAEPNDAGSPAAIVAGLPITGRVGGGDSEDRFLLPITGAGTLQLDLELDEGVDPAGLQIVVRDAGGTEIARVPATGRVTGLDLNLPAGDVSIAVEGPAGSPVGYRLETSFARGPVRVDSVTPPNGGPGTLVTIQGSGFDLLPANNRVLFGGYAGRVVSASATTLQVLVPANALDAPIVVQVGGVQSPPGPVYVAGRSDEPPSFYIAGDPSTWVRNPDDGSLVDLRRLAILVDPLTTEAEVNAAIAPLGGTIIASFPILDFYGIEFRANASLDGLEQLRQQLEALPFVLVATDAAHLEAQAPIDTRSRAQTWPNGAFAGRAYGRIGTFEAIDRIRSTQAFAAGQFRVPVGVAVIDSGFAPHITTEFDDPNGAEFVTAYRASPPVGGALSYFNGRLIPQVSADWVDRLNHGTGVASVIGAANDGRGRMSGMLNSLVRTPPGSAEAVFPLSVYGVQMPVGKGMDFFGFVASLADIVRAGDVDVLNMSLASPLEPTRERFYRGILGGPLRNTLTVVAAGNDGVDARTRLPCALSNTLPNVLCVGATAVQDVDGTGEGWDRRANFSGLGASNFGSVVNLAAPGEDVLMLSSTASNGGYLNTAFSQGTSFAAPMVAATAAMLQAIRPAGQAKFTPTRLRDLLLLTADDISSTWDRGNMLRLNVLDAVLAVLNAPAGQSVYVADRTLAAQAPAGAVSSLGDGSLVAIEVDPLDGSRLASTDRVLSLALQRGQTRFQGRQPLAIAVSPLGQEMAVLVESGTPDFGAGLVFVDTKSFQAVDFLPLNGDAWPGAPRSAPLGVLSSKPGLAYSPDGRVLYVTVDTRLRIVNVDDRKLVRRFRDLPHPYNVRAAQESRARPPRPTLVQRLDALEQAVLTGIPTLAPTGTIPGRTLGELAMSPDGRRLFAVVQTGGGTGHQPGALLPINVDLYRDALALTGLQPNLSGYLRPDIVTTTPPLSGSTPLLKMDDAGGFTGGDEPIAVAVSPDARFVYLINGGAEAFRGQAPNLADESSFLNLLGASFFYLALTGTGTLQGAITSVAIAPTLANTAYAVLKQDYERIIREGRTVLSAPGYTGVFTVTPQAGTPPRQPVYDARQSWLFPPNVTTGWQASADAGGLIINQVDQRDIYGKRPFDIAIRHDGKRALVPMYQTGNLGVLDLDTQRLFQRSPPVQPQPPQAVGGIFANLETDHFHAVTAVTPALRLDNHLWPVDGTFQAFRLPRTPDDSMRTTPSEEEAFLFPWETRYAQNGRFAVTAHAGPGALPDEVEIELPDFENDVPGVRLPLLRRGWVYSGGSTIQEPNNGPTRSVGDAVKFQTGGGAISILDDRALSTTLLRDRDTVVQPGNLQPRPFLSRNPACKVTEPSLPNICREQLVTRHRELRDPQAGDRRFQRPRGVAVQPFVTIDEPRFGDVVGPGQAITVRWRDIGVQRVAYSFYLVDELEYTRDPATSQAFPALGTTPPIALPRSAQSKKKYTRTFGSLFRTATGTNPRDGQKYRVEARICRSGQPCRPPQAQEEEPALSVEDVMIAFQQPPPRNCTTSARLDPTTAPLGNREIVFGTTRRFRYRITPAPGDTVTGLVRLEAPSGLAVLIRDAAINTGPVGEFDIEVLRELTSAFTELATEEFEVTLRYRLQACGEQTQTFKIPVKTTNQALSQVLIESFDGFPLDACQIDLADSDGFRQRVEARIVQEIGYNPFSQAGPGPPIKILIDAPGGPEVVEVVWSRVGVDLTSNVAGSGGTPGPGNPLFIVRGTFDSTLPTAQNIQTSIAFGDSQTVARCRQNGGTQCQLLVPTACSQGLTDGSSSPTVNWIVVVVQQYRRSP